MFNSEPSAKWGADHLLGHIGVPVTMLLVCPQCSHRYHVPVTIVHSYEVSFACRVCGANVTAKEHGGQSVSTAVDDAEWLVLQGGAVDGPFQTDVLLALGRQEQIRPDSLVWRPGMPDWGFAAGTPPLGPEASGGGKWWLKVNDVDDVIGGLEMVLDSDPDHEASVRALRLMVTSGRGAEKAAGVLEPILRARSDWHGLSDLFEERLSNSFDPQLRRSLRTQLADIAEAKQKPLKTLKKTLKSL